MKTHYFKVGSLSLLIVLQFVFSTGVVAQKNKHKKENVVDTINLKRDFQGVTYQIEFLKGENHNHPTFVIWLESLDGKLIETLFITEYFGKGVFAHRDAGDGRWEATKGESLRPAALPYWSHKRNIISRDSLYVPTPENPIADAITGPTPSGNFVLNTSVAQKLPEQYKIMMEINQTWDWNDYWTNNKFPDDQNYKNSAQPSLIYSTVIQNNGSDSNHILNVLGHGHYSGKDGLLYEELNTMSTALNIAKQIAISINY